VSTFHGRNVDDLGSWADAPRALVAVSRSHAEMLSSEAGISPDRITVVPNAVRDGLLDLDMRGFADRVEDGVARVVVASRLDADKRGLLECVDAITEVASSRDQWRWVVQVLGGGVARDEMAEYLDAQTVNAGHIEVEHLGWINSESVPDLLRGAAVAVASGRGAAQSLAVGTPVVAFGSQGVYGLQYGTNLDNGLWGNFGGHPLGDRPTGDIAREVAHVIDDVSVYARVQAAGRVAVKSCLLQSDADDRLDRLYRQVVTV
jgi:glycosyltransferase involved in cell wall biosynthesis